VSAGPPAIWAIVPAAGSGQRMGSATPKQYLRIAGASLLEHSLRALLAHPQVVGAVVALAADDPHWPELEARLSESVFPSAEMGFGSLDAPADRAAVAPANAIVKPILRSLGGRERADSVRAALGLLGQQHGATQNWALVHDAARPCLRVDDLDRLIQRCLRTGEGGLLAAPVRDTLKRVDPALASVDQRVLGTESRAGLWRALTPQLFPAVALADALDAAQAAGVAVTDEAMAMERVGAKPLLVEGAEDNLKVTTPADLALAEYVIGCREQGAGNLESSF